MGALAGFELSRFFLGPVGALLSVAGFGVEKGDKWKRGTLYFFGVEDGRVQLFKPFTVTREQVDTLSNESVPPKEWNAETGRRDGAEGRFPRVFASLRLCVNFQRTNVAIDPNRNSPRVPLRLREFRYD